MERHKTVVEKGALIASGVVLVMGAVAAGSTVALQPPVPVGFIPERQPLTQANPSMNSLKLRFPKLHGSFHPRR